MAGHDSPGFCVVPCLHGNAAPLCPVGAGAWYRDALYRYGAGHGYTAAVLRVLGGAHRHGAARLRRLAAVCGELGGHAGATRSGICTHPLLAPAGLCWGELLPTADLGAGGAAASNGAGAGALAAPCGGDRRIGASGRAAGHLGRGRLPFGRGCLGGSLGLESGTRAECASRSARTGALLRSRPERLPGACVACGCLLVGVGEHPLPQRAHRVYASGEASRACGSGVVPSAAQRTASVGAGRTCGDTSRGMDIQRARSQNCSSSQRLGDGTG